MGDWELFGAVPGSPAAEAQQPPDEGTLTDALVSWWHAYPSQQDDPDNTASRVWATTGETLPVNLDGAARAFVRYALRSPASPGTADEEAHAKVRAILEDVYGAVNPDVDARAVSALAAAGVLRTPTEPPPFNPDREHVAGELFAADHRAGYSPGALRDEFVEERYGHLADAVLNLVASGGRTGLTAEEQVEWDAMWADSDAATDGGTDA